MHHNGMENTLPVDAFLPDAMAN